MRSRPWLLAGSALLGACLLRNADPPRFFQPGSVALDATGEVGASPPAAGGVAIRLRAVRGAPFLRHRIVWRVSEVEYGLYEQRQWIDLPAHYAERALRTRLGETAGLRLTEDPRAAALRVDLLAFDEVFAPAHAADVALAVSLWDPERGGLLNRTFSARVGIADDEPASMARAMGLALDDVVAQVADAVVISVRAR